MKTNNYLMKMAIFFMAFNLCLLLSYNAILAQEGDTTKLKIGKKKIIVIDDDEKTRKPDKGIPELKNGINEFKTEILDIQDSIKVLQKKLDTIEKGSKDAESIDKSMSELEKKNQALEKGIKDIEDEIERIEKQPKRHYDTEGYDEDNEKEQSDKADKDKPEHFDWDFGRMWGKRHKKFNGHWGGIEFGPNYYFNSDMKMEAPVNGEFMELKSNKSWEFTINFLEYNIPFGTDNVGLVSGMGITWNHYNFKQNFDLKEVDGIMTAADPKSGINYDVNKLRVINLTVPLIFEIQSRPNHYVNKFYMAMGIFGSIRLDSDLFQEYELDDVDYKSDADGDFQLNTFRYGLTARMGLSFLRFYANYSFTPLFKKDKGPELYPFSMGFCLNF